jgi:hypothetical protein
MERLTEVTPHGESWRNGLVVASVALGLFSLAVIWWFPITAFFSGTGLVLGLVGMVNGIRGPHGERFGLGGVILCGYSLACSLFLMFGWQYFTALFAF